MSEQRRQYGHRIDSQRLFNIDHQTEMNRIENHFLDHKGRRLCVGAAPSTHLDFIQFHNELLK